MITLNGIGVGFRPYGPPDAEPIVLCLDHCTDKIRQTWARVIFKLPDIPELDIEVTPDKQCCNECLVQIIEEA